MGILPHFAEKSEPSDIVQFASPMEQAKLILKGEPSAKRLPTETSDWFLKISDEILRHVIDAEKVIGSHNNNEYISAITDLKILAYLAKYHSQRLLAAVHYNLYKETDHLASFDHAINCESRAVKAYGKLAESAGDVYKFQLAFGSNKQLFYDHWKDQHARLCVALEELKSERQAAVKAIINLWK